MRRLALRLLLLAMAVAVAVIIVVVRPWHTSSVGSEAVNVDRATLRPGQIVLFLVNGTEDSARVAQVILNDAFVDFHASRKAIAPGGAERITVWYPWISGEAYDIELMTSTGATVGYEIDDATSGVQTTEAS